MLKYYYNTTSTNDSNVILGYLTEDGDFSETLDEQENFVVAIIVKGGLLSAGNNFDSYCQQVAETVADKLKLS